MKSQKFGQKKGGHDGTRTRTHVGMSKRLDLRNKQQRTGKHEPSSCACNRAHRSYIHQEKMEKPEAWPKKGAHDGTRTRTHAGMSKRLDLRNKGQESTSHPSISPCGGF
jgi:hypothetical protein